MGRRSKADVIDGVCREWGIVRRQVTGVDDPRKAKDYIGALKCTLAQRRDMHAGSKTNFTESQHWPELYTGDAIYVNEAFHSMRPFQRVVMEIHYCSRASAEEKAEFLAVSMPAYWRYIQGVRAFIEGYLARSKVAA